MIFEKLDIIIDQKVSNKVKDEINLQMKSYAPSTASSNEMKVFRQSMSRNCFTRFSNSPEGTGLIEKMTTGNTAAETPLISREPTKEEKWIPEMSKNIT